MNEITVRKGNVELTVPEEQKDRYIQLGYSVYQGDTLIEEAPTTDVGALQHKIVELLAEIDSLHRLVEAKDNEIEGLTEELNKLQKSKK